MTSRILTRKDYSVALFLVGFTLLLGSGYMISGVSGVFHDDGIYLSTAKALAEGQGYRLINFPEAPPQTKYPPLYPALLALIWKLYPTFPDNLVIMQCVNLLMGAALAGLAYLYMVRFGYFSRGVAAGAAALTLTSVFYLYFCTLTLSEISFALLAVAALWALDRQLEGPSPARGAQFFLGVLLSLPLLTRTVGLIFLPLGIFRLWKGGKPLLWTTLGISTFLLPWLGWMLVIPHWSSGDAVSLYYTNYLTWGYSSWKTALGRVFFNNIFYTAFSTSAVGLNLFLAGVIIPRWASPLPILLGIVTWTAVVKDISRGGLLPAFLVAYLVIVLIWPWPPLRFLIPVLPFLLAYFLNLAKELLMQAPRFRPRWSGPIFFGAALAVNLTFLGHITGLSHKGHYPVIVPRQEAVAWQSYQDIFQWIKAHTRPNDVIASGFDTMIFLYTGRQAFRPFVGRPSYLFYGGQGPPVGSREEIFHFLELYKPRFLVQLPMPGFREEKPVAAAIEDLVAACPGLFAPAYAAPDSRFVIYEICWPQAVGCPQ